MRPPFDPAEFARESESGQQSAAPAAPESSPPISSARPTPRSFHRPQVPPTQWGRTRPTEPSAPDVEERGGETDPLDLLGRGAIPVLAKSRDQIARTPLSPEARKLLAAVDGVLTLAALFALTGVAPRDGAATFLELADKGFVTFR